MQLIHNNQMDREAFDLIASQLDNAYTYFPEPKKLKLEKQEQSHLLKKRPANPVTAVPDKKDKSKKRPLKAKVIN